MKLKASVLMYALGYASIAASAYRYLTNEDSGDERDGLFMGHWAPTFFILGKAAEDREVRGHPTWSLDWESGK
ncbi:hypothetical protein Deipr_0201 [Deinococcus proteolyticus MRP]|uniref:Uncharacterized protein n=1 Tax=Deinococcus proteolyticus (strain ATCC 35074 / DSM 20540 / JCM 6276 / NBRC 101906 / NCIMB 13154 / VKM Ac-1939 / CCM 2703 / MRP) TaxID=693977 RepID=F0RP59_DEIPM|nr:hypothetical protein [Deinococcus sp. SL84]ADY25374.1 hypothetical protein Deipr_0201 [Deinococcus proteolyticus MRP]